MKADPKGLLRTFTLVSLLAGAVMVAAQEAEKPYAQTRFTDTDIVDIAEAVEAYVYGKPPAPKSMKVFDTEKGEILTVTYQKILTDPGSAKDLGKGWALVSAEFKADNGDAYVLWFTLKRKTEREERRVGTAILKMKPLGSFTVRDVTIRSVNGQERLSLEQGEDGVWRGVAAEEGEEAPAAEADE